MKITTCTINVGNGEGNRNMVLDDLRFVDVFFILDCPTNDRGEYVDHENHEYELVSSVENGDVEVYIRTSMIGWFAIESHKKESVIIRYEEEGTGKVKRIGAVYIRPLREATEMEKRIEELTVCDLIIGDLNARNPIWGREANDEGTNAYGRKLQQWIDKENRVVARNKEKTFRQTSVLDITIYKKGEETPIRQLTDKCGLEHIGQLVRLKVEVPKNLKKKNVAWKKVDWKVMEEDLKKLKIGKEEGWESLKEKMEKLPKSKERKGESSWWTDEIERMAKDVGKMRREGKEGWKIARKVFRNTIITKRYEKMKEDLGNMKDPLIFRAIKQLEGRRAIPPITKNDGNKIFEHEEISDLIAQQLNPIEKISDDIEENCEVDITEDEIDYGIKTSPSNTATGIDGISYPMIRFWRRKEREGCGRAIRIWATEGCEDWKRAEPVLIRKGDKERYDVVKSWRMIHLLPILSKVVDRIILNELAKTVRMEETQYGSRKNRSTHDAMKQILEFLKYNKNRYTGILSMDVEGGFDKVNIDMLSDIVMYRECERGLVKWIRRWTKGRSIHLRFNGKVSKEYQLNKGVPQGSALSPFLFGVYVADMFRSRICCRIDLRRMVSSYVDDGVILVSTENKRKTKHQPVECFEDCKKIAKERGMDFSEKKLDWMGIGKGDWGKLEMGGIGLNMVKEIRILGYRIDNNRK